MSVLDPERATEIFGAIETIRTWLPEAEALSELIPFIGDDLVKGEKFLGKLFELVSVLRSHDTAADAAATLRRQTEEDWAQALRKE